MNHLVLLDAQAGELENILSGVKTMLVKEFNPAQVTPHPVSPGDSLYFLRNRDDRALRVRATVVRVLFVGNREDDELSQTLKEMQPKLQLTESQYNDWTARRQVLLVEFASAGKMEVIYVAPDRIPDPSIWIAFEEFRHITEEEHVHEHQAFTPRSS
jgi:hypothetical protein